MNETLHLVKDAARELGTSVSTLRKKTYEGKTEEIGELLEALGCNPIEGMAKIAANPKNKPELRGRMYAELAKYIYPKRKAGEVFGADANPPVEADWATVMREVRARRMKENADS